MKRSMLYLVCALAMSPFSVYSQQDNKTIIYGGDIYSADASNPHPEAIGIEGEKIVAVGKYQDVLKLVGEHARQIDLKGRYLMPGMIPMPTSLMPVFRR